MERKLTTFLVVVASMLLMAGCYTQIGTTRDEPSSDYSYNDQDSNSQPDTASGGGYDDDYWRYRDQFYSNYYYNPPMYDPWGYRNGIVMGGYYSPFWWNPWDPWYPGGGWYYPYSSYSGLYGGYYGSYYGGHGYYGAYAGSPGHGTTRNFGVTRRSGSIRGTGTPPDLRRGASGSGSGSVALPSGNSRGSYRPAATPRAPSAATGRSNNGRKGEADRAGHNRTGNSRAGGRYSAPPPPPPRSGGQSRGGERWTPPPSPPPASSAPASAPAPSGGSSGGSRGGGSGSSGGSSGGGSRGGNHR